MLQGAQASRHRGAIFLTKTQTDRPETGDDEDSQISVQAALEAFAFSQSGLPRRGSWSLVVSRVPVGFAAPLCTSILAMPGKVRELWCVA